jgi:NAD(P)H-flavin reductase
MTSMRHYKGRLAELLLEPYQNATARLACPQEAAPKPGQYLQAFDPSDELEAVTTELFAAGAVDRGQAGEVSLPIQAALPESWQPGTLLQLRGPLGRGFELTRRAQRVALVALGGNPGRLLPLVTPALRQQAEVVLCCDAPVRELPMAVEVQGLDGLPEALRWADYAAMDLPLEEVDQLPAFLSRVPRQVHGEALVFTPMPCGGRAQCGVCTVTTAKGARLACEEGPVFSLGEIT